MSLSPTQQEALEQLWAVTASENSSARERDERVLREAGWDVQVSLIFRRVTITADLQRAVEQIFSGAASSAPQPPRGGSSRGPSRSTTIDGHDGFGIQPPPGSRRLSGTGGIPRSPSGAGTSGVGLWGLLSSPVRLIWSILTGTWYFFSELPTPPLRLQDPSSSQSAPLSHSPSFPDYLVSSSRPTGRLRKPGHKTPHKHPWHS